MHVEDSADQRRAGPDRSRLGRTDGRDRLRHMGGALFTTTITPTRALPIGSSVLVRGTSAMKATGRPCVSLGGNAWWTASARGAYAAPRSNHPGGVGGALADGSVNFFVNDVDTTVWRSLGTRQGQEPISATY